MLFNRVCHRLYKIVQNLAHMVRHWTPKPVIISCIRSSPTGGNFLFAVINSFEYKNAISANFVQTVKNSNVDNLTVIEMTLFLRCSFQGTPWGLETVSRFNFCTGTYKYYSSQNQF